MARLRFGPLARVLTLALGAAAFALALGSGVWSRLSILKEYATRADVFWREAGQHLVLAVGSLAAAVVIGLPLGVLIERKKALRAPVLNTLNAIQTIPSIALFGILIGPLGLDFRPRARRRGARRARHRRRAGVPCAVPLFAAADDGEYGRRS